MFHCALLVAQLPTDPLSGGAGWAGAGLLSLVLGWLLLKHLPDKDKHIQGIIDRHAAILDAIATKHEAGVKLLADKHELAMAAAAEKHAKVVEALAAKHEQSVTRVSEQHAKVADSMAVSFSSSMDRVVEHCKEEMDRIIGYWTTKGTEK